MKRSLLSLLLVAGAWGVMVANDASTPKIVLTQEKLRLIEQNLIIGLESNIPTLQASAALVLCQVKEIAPEYEFSLSVIPLMRLVRTERYDPTVRMAAALALHGLRTAQGDFAIARIAKFEDNPRVKKLLQAMAYERGLQSNLY
jgi:hypothetical protein